MLCFRCGSQVPSAAAACQNCGQPVSATQRASMATPTLPRVVQRTLQSPLPFKLNDVAAGRYEIRRLIGEGPLGVVYVAHDRETEVDLALKVIRPAVLQRPQDRDAFFEAMRRVRGVGHFSLNHVIDVDRDGERCFYTAPLLEGLSLRKLMALRRSRSEKFGLSEVVPIAAQVADALEAGARIGAHGDLKPDNVVILPEMLKVTDFGLAAAVPRAAFISAQQRAVESSAYLAPEIREGGDPDVRADLYSFGVLVTELLTGQIVASAPVRLRDYQPSLPAALDAVVNRLLDEEPAARPDSPEEAVQDLAAAESGTSRSALRGPVRRTFGPEQTQRISMDMLEEVLETSEGMDEDAFARSIEDHAKAIDRQAEAALATDGLTDPGVPAHARRSEPPSPDVTQKLSTDMVVEMLQGEALEQRRAPRTLVDSEGLDPRLVRAALGMELDESDPTRTEPSFTLDDEEGSDVTAQALPHLAHGDGELLPGERTEQMLPFDEVTAPTDEARTALERPLPEHTGPATPLPPRPAPPGRSAPVPPSPTRPPPAPRTSPPSGEVPRPGAPGGAAAERSRPAAAPAAPAAPAAAPAPRAVAAAPAAPPAPRAPAAPARPAGPVTTLPGAAGPAPPALPSSPPARPAAPAKAEAPAARGAGERAAIRAAPAGATLLGPGAAPAPQPPPAAAAAPAPVVVPASAPTPVQHTASASSGSGPRSAPRAQPVAAPASSVVPAPPPGVSDEWYAQGKELPDADVDVDVEIIDRGASGSGGRRREQTRIVPRYEEQVRDNSGIWVWVALAVGASAFLIGAGFYWQRLRRDRQQQQIQQILQQQQQPQPQPQPQQPPLPMQPQPQQQLQPQPLPQPQPQPLPQPQPQLQPLPVQPQPQLEPQPPAPIGQPSGAPQPPAAVP